MQSWDSRRPLKPPATCDVLESGYRDVAPATLVGPTRVASRCLTRALVGTPAREPASNCPRFRADCRARAGCSQTHACMSLPLAKIARSVTSVSSARSDGMRPHPGTTPIPVTGEREAHASALLDGLVSRSIASLVQRIVCVAKNHHTCSQRVDTHGVLRARLHRHQLARLQRPGVVVQNAVEHKG